MLVSKFFEVFYINIGNKLLNRDRAKKTQRPMVKDRVILASQLFSASGATLVTMLIKALDKGDFCSFFSNRAAKDNSALLSL